MGRQRIARLMNMAHDYGIFAYVQNSGNTDFYLPRHGAANVSAQESNAIRARSWASTLRQSDKPRLAAAKNRSRSSTVAEDSCASTLSVAGLWMVRTVALRPTDPVAADM